MLNESPHTTHREGKQSWEQLNVLQDVSSVNGFSTVTFVLCSQLLHHTYTQLYFTTFIGWFQRFVFKHKAGMQESECNKTNEFIFQYSADNHMKNKIVF